MTTTTDHAKPVPVPDEASRPFFEGASRGELLLQRCTACETYLWPVKSRCAECFAAGLEWALASGKGTLYSFTVVHQLYHPGFAGEIPYNIAVIELEEGVRMTVNVVGCDNSELHIGMPLEVCFEERGGVSLPMFRPVR